VKSAPTARRIATPAVTIPAMAIPPPFQTCGSRRIFPRPMTPTTRLAMASGMPRNPQQQVGIERMPRTIDVIASGWKRGAIGANGAPGGPKPPGGGP
jgi:hypothetical protein